MAKASNAALKHSVKLYVYEISQGMARTMSSALIGRQIDGVWHTGVAAYGNEYFFGSGGISYCPPRGTILGHPTEVVDLGYTEIPMDVFHEYLVELERDRFRGDRYHLLNHNCNNFSNEVAQFLTGHSIPEKITNLPGEIMSTPLGQMIIPWVDNMMQQINAGTHVTSRDHSRSSGGGGGGASGRSVNSRATSGENRKKQSDKTGKSESETASQSKTSESVDGNESKDKKTGPNDWDLD